MTSEILMLEDGCTLLRLLMADEHYKDGSVTDNGISLQVLQDRGYSLDIKSMAVQAVIEERAQTQSLKRPVERHTAFISEFTKNDATSVVEPDNQSQLQSSGSRLFDVSHSPIDENPAHASLLCVKRDQKRAYYVMARNKLKPIIQRIVVKLDEYYV